MTHGKRRDICTAIRTKHEEPFKSCGLSSPPYKFHHFSLPSQLSRCMSGSSLFSAPAFATLRALLSHWPFFPFPLRLTTLPSLFEPRRTVYKVALLNWKPQLCRCCSHPLLLHLACFFSTAAVPSPSLFAPAPVQARWSGWIVVRVDIRAGFIDLAGSSNFFRDWSIKDPKGRRIPPVENSSVPTL